MYSTLDRWLPSTGATAGWSGSALGEVRPGPGAELLLQPTAHHFQDAEVDGRLFLQHEVEPMAVDAFLGEVIALAVLGDLRGRGQPPQLLRGEHGEDRHLPEPLQVDIRHAGILSRPSPPLPSEMRLSAVPPVPMLPGWTGPPASFAAVRPTTPTS